MIELILIAALTTTPPVPAVVANVSTNGTLPAEIRTESIAAGRTYTRSDGSTAIIGAPVVSSDGGYQLKDIRERPSVRPDKSGKLVLGKPLEPVEDTRPFFRTLVWNDLAGGYIEYRAYMPGNSAFVKTEVVIP